MIDEYEMVWKDIIENEDGSINWINLKEILARYSSIKTDHSYLVEMVSGELNNNDDDIIEVIKTMDDLIVDMIDACIVGELTTILDNIEGAHDPMDIYDYILSRKEDYERPTTS